MKQFARALLAAIVFAAIPLSAQNAVPSMNFDSASNPLALPDDVYLGEVGGVATNSRGDILVYTRTGHRAPAWHQATAWRYSARRDGLACCAGSTAAAPQPRLTRQTPLALVLERKRGIQGDRHAL